VQGVPNVNIDPNIVLPFALVFLPILGVMVFIETYLHYPKMEERKRIMLSARSAIFLALALAVLTYLFIVIFFQSL